MYWLNVDYPNKQCTLHREGCRWKPRKEPGYKGFGRMKRDGGWLSFKTENDAAAYFRSEWQSKGFKWVRCPSCRE